MPSSAPSRLPLVVLLSGRGSNFQALLKAIQDGSLPAEIRAVISNRPDAAGLDIARDAGISAEVVDHTGYADRESYDRELQRRIDAHDPALVVLAGFMRILTAGFVRHYLGRLINIHPSLLPRYRGLDTHSRVLAAGDREHGASVHFVTEELDGGPVLIQARVPVLPDDDATTLAERVLEQEHRLYPEAVRLIASGRVCWKDREPWLDGSPLRQPLLLDDHAP